MVYFISISKFPCFKRDLSNDDRCLIEFVRERVKLSSLVEFELESASVFEGSVDLTEQLPVVKLRIVKLEVKHLSEVSDGDLHRDLC